jgi:hypothetical protein
VKDFDAILAGYDECDWVGGRMLTLLSFYADVTDLDFFACLNFFQSVGREGNF